MKGYEWIGWKRKISNNNTQEIVTQSLPYVPIAFKFDYFRNFSSVLIHCNNMFTKDIQVFTKAIVQFSLNGIFNSNNKHSTAKTQIIFDIPNDMHNDTARFIRLDLGYNIARYIRIKLYFSSKWLLVSEIDFHSVPISQHEEEVVMVSKTNVVVSTHQTTTTTTTTKVVEQATPPTSTPLIKQYYVIILVISSLILISILGLIIAVILLNKQKYKNKSVKLHK
jgi:discoidin domain receptor family protein 2